MHSPLMLHVFPFLCLIPFLEGGKAYQSDLCPTSTELAFAESGGFFDDVSEVEWAVRKDIWFDWRMKAARGRWKTELIDVHWQPAFSCRDAA